jgi:hypothetical protein
MKRLYLAILAISILVLGLDSAFAKKIYSLKTGNWKGGAYTNNQTGRFSHCAASVKYKSGILLLFSVTRTRRWNMGLSNSSWNLTPNQKYPVKYRVDNGNLIRGTAIAKSRKLVQVFLPTSDRLFRQFKKGQRLTIWAARQKMRFSLNGSSRMLSLLLKCANFYVKKEKSRNNPFEPNNNNPFTPRQKRPVRTDKSNPFDVRFNFSTPKKQSTGQSQNES